MENNQPTITMATEKVKAALSFQKQFDTLTSSLNLFDMSFLVSGTAMLGVCFLAFPVLVPLFLHGEHIILSILLCILFAYIIGLMSRIIAKEVARWLGGLFNSPDSITDEAFEKYFEKIIDKNSPLYVMHERNSKDVIYSYMWMKLETSTNHDCRTRFLYVSRIWVLRAIFEGLIAPTLLLAVTISINCFKPILPLFVNVEAIVGSTFLMWLCPAIVILTLFVVYLLAKEANHCANTQMREVVVAYFDFIEDGR